MSQQDLNANKQLFGRTSSETVAEINSDYTLDQNLKNYYYQNPDEYKEYRKDLPYEVGLNDRVERFKNFMSDPQTFAAFKDAGEYLKNLNKQSEQIELDNADIFSKWMYNFDKSRISQDASDAFADWADASHNHQYLKAWEKKKEYDLLKMKLEEDFDLDVNYDNALLLGDLWYGTSDLLASQWNWQTALATAGTVAGSFVNPFLGASVGAAIGFNRTRDVEMGSVLEEILAENPDIDFEQAYSIANKAGTINALIESSDYFIGGAKSITSKTIKSLFTKDAAKDLVKKESKKYLIGNILKGAAEVAKDSIAEGVQETLQDKVQLAAKESVNLVKNGNEELSSLEMFGLAAGKDLTGFYNILTSSDLSPEDKEQLKTFSRTALGSLGLSGVRMFVQNIKNTLIDLNNAKQDKIKQEKLQQQALNVAKALPKTEREKIIQAVAEQIKDNVITVPAEIFQKLNENVDKYDEDTKVLIERLNETSQELPSGKYSLDKETYADIMVNNQELFQTIKENSRLTTDGLTETEGKEVIKNLIKESELLQKNETAKQAFNQMVNTLSKSAGYDNTQAKINSLMFVNMVGNLASASGSNFEDALNNINLAILDERNKINNAKENVYKKTKKRLFTEKLGGETVTRENVDLKTLQVSEGFNMDLVSGQNYSQDMANGILLYRTKEGQLLSLEGDKKIAIAKLSPNETIANAIIFDENKTNFEKAKQVAQKIQAERKKDLAMLSAGKELEKMRKAIKKPKRTFKSLSEFISSKAVGGIKDIDGWLARGLDKRGNKVVNNKSGISYENAMEKAFDAGYFPDISDIRQEMTVSDFIDSVLEDYAAEEANKRYSTNDYDAMENYFRNNFDPIWEEAGLDPILDTKETAYEKLKAIDGWEDYITGEMESFPEELYQAVTGDMKAGSTQEIDGQTIIKFMEATNPTTFLHEMNHVFTRKMIGLFEKGLLNSDWKKSFSDAVEWAGGKIENGKVILGRDGYEKLANGFTKYFAEGKAPISSLKKLFAYFSSLFEKVYKMLRIDRSMRLNKKVTDYFDRMILTRDQIRQRDLENKVVTFDKPNGVSTSDWVNYLEQTNELVSTRSNLYMRTVENRMKFTSDLRFQKHEKEVRQQVIEELLQNPIYQIQEFTLDQKINPDTVPEGVELPPAYLDKNGIDYEVFLNDVKGRYGEEYSSQLPNILKSPGLETAVKNKTILRMNNWLREMPQFQNLDFDKLTADMTGFKHLCYRYCLLAGIPTSKIGEYTSKLMVEAQNMINSLPISEISNYEKQMKIYRNLALQYPLNNKEKMAQATERLAIQMFAVKRSLDIRNEVNTFSDNFKHYLKDFNPKKDKAVNGEVWDIMNAFLYNNKYTKKVPKNKINLLDRVNHFIEKSPAIFSAIKGLQNKEVLKQTTSEKREKFNSMRYEDFNNLRNVMEEIEAAGKELNQIHLGEEKENIDSIADEVVQNLIEKQIKPLENANKIYEFFLNARTAGTTLKNWLGEKVYEKIYLPLADAVAKKENLQKEMTKDFVDVLSLDKDLFKRDYTFSYGGKNYTFNAETMLAIILNCGNTANENKLVTTLNKKYGLDVENTVSILNQMPKELLELANNMFKVFDKRKEQMKQVIAEINNGKELKLVEAEPKVLTLANGEEFVYNGGYFPLVNKDGKSEIKLNGENNVMDVNSFPIASFLKDRQDVVKGYVIDLSLNPIRNYIFQTSSTLTMAKPYNDLVKVLNNEKVRYGLGDVRTKYLKDWLDNFIRPEQIEWGLSQLCAFSTFAALSGKVVSMVTQALGLVTGFVTVGPQYMAKSIASQLNPANWSTFVHPAKTLMEKSEGMRSRYDNFEQRIDDIISGKNETIATLKGITKVGAKVLMMSYEYGDAIASNIVWDAEYEKQLSLTGDETIAKMKADNMVRTTQGDSSTLSKTKFLRGNLKFLNRFMSYYFSMYSNIMASLENKDRIQALKMTAGFVAAISVSAAGEAYFKSIINGDNDDDKKKKILVNMGESLANSFLPMYSIGATAFGTFAGEKNIVTSMHGMYVADFFKALKYATQGEFEKAGIKGVSLVSRNIGKHLKNISEKNIDWKDEFF